MLPDTRRHLASKDRSDSIMRATLQLPTDNELWYRALAAWIKERPEERGTKRLGDLNTNEFTEILEYVQEFKQRRIHSRWTEQDFWEKPCRICSSPRNKCCC